MHLHISFFFIFISVGHHLTLKRSWIISQQINLPNYGLLHEILKLLYKQSANDFKLFIYVTSCLFHA